MFGEARSQKDESPVGSLIAQLADPFALEVHRPIALISTAASSKALAFPPYILRSHDEKLAEVVSIAAAGQNTIACAEIVSPHATCAYLRMRPLSRSRHRTRTLSGNCRVEVGRLAPNPHVMTRLADR